MLVLHPRFFPPSGCHVSYFFPGSSFSFRLPIVVIGFTSHLRKPSSLNRISLLLCFLFSLHPPWSITFWARFWAMFNGPPPAPPKAFFFCRGVSLRGERDRLFSSFSLFFLSTDSPPRKDFFFPFSHSPFPRGLVLDPALPPQEVVRGFLVLCLEQPSKNNFLRWNAFFTLPLSSPLSPRGLLPPPPFPPPLVGREGPLRTFFSSPQQSIRDSHGFPPWRAPPPFFLPFHSA